MKILKKIISWIFWWFGKPEILRPSGWGTGKPARRDVTFHKIAWTTGEHGIMPNDTGTYLVKHRGKTRKSIFKRVLHIYKSEWGDVTGWIYGWVADFRDNVFMKGVTAWAPCPANLLSDY